ncbi:MAG: 5-oxoprolinase subunit PxpB [Marinicellaceae bacterium]
MPDYLRFPIETFTFGPKVLVINWPQTICNQLNSKINQFEQLVHDKIGQMIVESLTTYCSLTLYLNEPIKSGLTDYIKKLYATFHANGYPKQESITWNIPVCYDLKFATDLESLANYHSLSIQEVVKRHSQPIYTVFFLGFLPGFPYLGGLDKQLFTPRLIQPRDRVSAGSVAIGQQQTGIYPIQSPGGWHIIGKTPIPIFNAKNKKPALFKQGDLIKFSAISLEKYDAILKSINKNTFNLDEIKMESNKND